MRVSKFPFSTVKEIPADAEIVSHQLMLKAGLIRKLASGLYTWMPYGLRTLRKVENIVREEMDNAGAIEILMPAVQPAELWQESKRWEQYGPELLRLHDRHQREFCVGPTHEEVITDLARRELKSYKQLPINFYQIQTKFRDEIRPRFGIMRAREFVMKDAYSFHKSAECLHRTYELMFETYQSIFTRLGLNFRAVQADTGSIGGNTSHEFHVLAESGEDAIAFSTTGDFAANVELAPTTFSTSSGDIPNTLVLEKISTPEQKSIAQVCEYLQVSPQQCVKTLVVKGVNGVVAIVLRGDHELNAVKAEKTGKISVPLTMANEQEIRDAFNCEPGFIGPVGVDCTLLIDHAAAALSNFICGANESGFHFRNANWNRDAQCEEHFDLRNIEAGDPSPDGQGIIEIQRGIEVGHIFQLGQKYSQEMNASVLDQNGKACTLTMGCYGIGVSRVVAAAIEQNHDEQGICWPASIAPFEVSIIPINMHKSNTLALEVERIYQSMQNLNIDVLLDDRPIRPGAMFADHELMGIPHRIVLSDRSLEERRAEYKGRTDKESTDVPIDQLTDFLLNKLPGKT